MTLDRWTDRAEPLTTIDPLQIKGVADSPHLKNLLNMFKRGQDKLSEQVATVKHAPRDQTVRAHVPANAQVRKQIARLEKVAGALPLSSSTKWLVPSTGLDLTLRWRPQTVIFARIRWWSSPSRKFWRK
jgi:hypothetical protein